MQVRTAPVDAPPLILVVDAWLPYLAEAETKEDGSYLCEDLLDTIPQLAPWQLFVPNIDLAVVSALRERGIVHAWRGCV